MRSRYFVLGLLLALTGSALAVVQGGFPSMPYFNGVNVGHAPNGVLAGTLQLARAGGPTVFLYDSTRSANQHYAQISFTGGSILGGTCPDNLSGCTTGDLTPIDSGPVTWSFQTANSNCSANGTDITVQLHRIGKLVFARTAIATGTCTVASIDNQGTTNTPVPAAFRPASNFSCAAGLITTNALGSTLGRICVSSTGNFQLLTAPTSSSTSLGVLGGTNWVYSLD